ncbi:pentapeptide repeat-containing protein [Celeribacter neptunius]|uniref:Pentapeptide repeat-containing protein n=1 Tax=Celeribacter neptunius TaxID=588602 RepID=A0A1I3J7J3_9RHOB|nr:pentapeptide repeat-containing protein [Celeribacter neptunius]SFI55865.1 Pentapeptide repeat-containing protein [Celeribacter neptunius]
MFTVLYVTLGAVALLLTALITIWLWRRPGWTGFEGRTLWDWMGILTIPAYLGFGSLVLGLVQLEIAELRAEEAAFQTYLDRISALDLAEPQSQAIARAQTGAVMTQVTGPRAARVLQFLSDLGALKTIRPDLDGHDLRSAELKGLDLSGFSFEEADLRGVDFEGARLWNTSFEDANLKGADFKSADLSGTDFTGANMRGVTLSHALLSGTVLSGARHLSAAELARACAAERACREAEEEEDDEDDD